MYLLSSNLSLLPVFPLASKPQNQKTTEMLLLYMYTNFHQM